MLKSPIRTTDSNNQQVLPEKESAEVTHQSDSMNRDQHGAPVAGAPEHYHVPGEPQKAWLRARRLPDDPVRENAIPDAPQLQKNMPGPRAEIDD